MADQQDENASDALKSDEERIQYIFDGGYRKSLGLSREDLRLGLDLAKSQLQRGQNAEAFRTYATMILCDPSDPELQLGLANCALLVGEHSLALQAASAAIILQPEDCRAYFVSGKACLALDLRNESKEDFERALELSQGTQYLAVTVGAQKYLNMLESTI